MPAAKCVINFGLGGNFGYLTFTEENFSIMIWLRLQSSSLVDFEPMLSDLSSLFQEQPIIQYSIVASNFGSGTASLSLNFEVPNLSTSYLGFRLELIWASCRI